MSIAVVTPTYPRADRSTPRHLRSTAARLSRQTWDGAGVTWLLVGDHYPDGEWDALLSEVSALFSGTLLSLNTPRAVREISGLHPANLWTAGGMDARLLGWQTAYDRAFEYVLWLDDDEEWHDDHMSAVVDALHHRPDCDLSFTAARYGSIVLPRSFDPLGRGQPLDADPLPNDTVSSTLCLRHGPALELMLHVWRLHTEAVYTRPDELLPNEDARFLWACHERGVKAVFVPRITVTKRTQRDLVLP